MNSKTAKLGSAIILLLVGAAAGYFYGVNSLAGTTTADTSATPDSYEQVAGANAIHLLLLDSGNVSGLMKGYEGNATFLVVGGWNKVNTTSLPAQHGYRLSAIRSTLGSFLGQFYNFSLLKESQILRPNGTNWVVNSTFSFSGDGGPAGNINGTVVAQDSYVHVGNSWLIEHETWNFTQYHVQHYTST